MAPRIFSSEGFSPDFMAVNTTVAIPVTATAAVASLAWNCSAKESLVLGVLQPQVGEDLVDPGERAHPLFRGQVGPGELSLEDAEGLAVALVNQLHAAVVRRERSVVGLRRIIEHRLGHLRKLGDLVEELLRDLGIDLWQHLHELENVFFSEVPPGVDLKKLLDCDLCAVRRHTSGIGTVPVAHERCRCEQQHEDLVECAGTVLCLAHSARAVTFLEARRALPLCPRSGTRRASG